MPPKTVKEMCRGCKGAKVVRKSKQPCARCKGKGYVEKGQVVQLPPQ